MSPEALIAILESASSTVLLALGVQAEVEKLARQQIRSNEISEAERNMVLQKLAAVREKVNTAIVPNYERVEPDPNNG